MVNERGFNLKSPAALAPHRRVSLSFAALKPGADSPSPAVSVLDDVYNLRLLFHRETLLSSVAAFMNHLSWAFWVTCCSFSISACCFTWHFGVMEAA